MKRIHTQRHIINIDSQKFKYFYSKIVPCVFYPVEELVKQYNSILIDKPVNNFALGRLSDVRENFTKYRKEADGKTKIFYVKKIN